MANIYNLAKSITEISKKESVDLILNIRKQRRIAKGKFARKTATIKRKTTKKQKINLEKLTDNNKNTLIKLLEEMMQNETGAS